MFENSEFLYDNLCSESVLKTAFLAVRKNKGAPGIDGVNIDDFQNNLNKEITKLSEELASFRYKPQPARRVEIPKPSKKFGKPEFRKLGIPCVRDRVVQHAMKSLLEPFFEPNFSEHSYGFRPGRNARQAVEAAQDFCKEGKDICVDIDLEKFFDKVSHDRLIARMSLSIKDKRILKLVGITLRGGVIENGVKVSTEEGTAQGSPLSPLLSNIVLDELDKELEKRGLSFCRYADDCNIFVKSKFAANRAMENITKFIEKKLKLKINKSKSKVALSRNVKFLGMTIAAKKIQISKESMQRAMSKLKSLTKRNDGQSIEHSIQRFNKWYIGWSAYHSMTQYPSQFRNIEGHARRRLRAKLVKHSKRPIYLFRKLVKMMIHHKNAATVFKNKKCWATSTLPAMHMAFTNEWFEKQGLYTMSGKGLDHWLPLSYRTS